MIDPNEVDKQELMEKTKMSLSQITVWFTNARVKMRKENKLSLDFYKKKKKEQVNLNILSSSINNIDLSISLKSNDKQRTVVMAYSCLNIQQIVC